MAAVKRGQARAAGSSVEAVDLSEDYVKARGRIAERRLFQAGCRLGAILKKIVAE
jgi:hypothetical protein